MYINVEFYYECQSSMFFTYSIVIIICYTNQVSRSNYWHTIIIEDIDKQRKAIENPIDIKWSENFMHSLL